MKKSTPKAQTKSPVSSTPQKIIAPQFRLPGFEKIKPGPKPTGKTIHSLWMDESIWLKIVDEAKASGKRPSEIVENYAEIIWHLREAGFRC